MKFKDCADPLGPLVKLTADNCTQMLEQVRRAGYQLLGQPSTQLTAANIKIKATWDPLLAATDSKLIVLPKKNFYSPEIPASEPVFVGSNDNTTPNGVSILRGESIVTFTAQYNGLQSSDYEGIEKLFSEGNFNVDYPTLGVHLFLGEDQLMTGKDYQPIPIRVPYLSTPSGGQLHALTLFNVQFQLEKGWFRDVQVIRLPFKHRDLIN